jgi:hypothetical protein
LTEREMMAGMKAPKWHLEEQAGETDALKVTG